MYKASLGIKRIMITLSNGIIFRITGPCEENPPVTGRFPSQRPVTQSFNIFFDRRQNKRLSRQSRRWGIETPSCTLWRHSNGEWGCLADGDVQWTTWHRTSEKSLSESMITMISNTKMHHHHPKYWTKRVLLQFRNALIYFRRNI